jgi:hypothetical protein
MTTLLDLPDENELKQLIGTKPYWDQSHPDHESTYQRVQDGFKRLYPARNKGNLSWQPAPGPTDEAFQANLERGRQWARQRGYQMQMQADAQDKGKVEVPPYTPGRPHPTLTLPPTPPREPDMFEGWGSWKQKLDWKIREWQGLPNPPPPPPQKVDSGGKRK